MKQLIAQTKGGFPLMKILTATTLSFNMLPAPSSFVFALAANTLSNTGVAEGNSKIVCTILPFIPFCKKK